MLEELVFHDMTDKISVLSPTIHLSSLLLNNFYDKQKPYFYDGNDSIKMLNKYFSLYTNPIWNVHLYNYHFTVTFDSVIYYNNGVDFGDIRGDFETKIELAYSDTKCTLKGISTELYDEYVMTHLGVYMYYSGGMISDLNYADIEDDDKEFFYRNLMVQNENDKIVFMPRLITNIKRFTKLYKRANIRYSIFEEMA